MPTRFIVSVADAAERLAVTAAQPFAADVSPLVYQQDEKSLYSYDPVDEAWTRILGDTSGVQTAQVTLTTAEANAGADLLPAIEGKKYRLVDFAVVALGGNAATATSVRIRGTQATSVVSLAIIAVAALTRSTAVKPNSANVTLLADGAAFSPCDANTAIAMDVDNDNLATATGLQFNLAFVLEDE